MIRRSRSASTALGASGAGNPSPGVPADQRSEESQSNAQRLRANNEYAEIALAELDDNPGYYWQNPAGTAAAFYWTLNGKRVPYHSRMDRRYSAVARDRWDFCRRYSFAIPNDRAVAAIAGLGPIIEVGCGTGYWAKLIAEAGGDILPIDQGAPLAGTDLMTAGHHEGQQTWTEITRGTTRAPVRHPRPVLFLCWPPYDVSMARRALAAHEEAGGQIVAYVGEGLGGCTGDDAFHRALGEGWREVDDIAIPQWWGVHDRLTIHKKRRRRR